MALRFYKKERDTTGILDHPSHSVYEKLFKTSDIMSVFTGIRVGHSSRFSGHFGCHKLYFQMFLSDIMSDVLGANVGHSV